VTDLTAILPFFIVSDLARAVAFYRDVLGFDVRVLVPDDEPFFAIVGSGPVGIMLKHISAEVGPLPNPVRHPWAKWDAYVGANEPEVLAAECRERAAQLGLGAYGADLRLDVQDTEDGLRGFELTDPDGYVLFFGHPR
jgi:catechol 2,3-dioxygenase-like lactoylglutathione lyase family enzyme